MLKIDKIEHYLDKYPFLSGNKSVIDDYRKIEQASYGKSLTPMTFHHNALFLGIGTGIDILIFREHNPYSPIIIIENDQEKIDNLSTLALDNIIFFNSVESYNLEITEFDYVRIHENHLSLNKLNYLVEKFNFHKICGDFYEKNTNIVELFYLIRKKCDLFFLRSLDGKNTLSGYREKNDIDITIVIATNNDKERLMRSLESIKKQNMAVGEVIISRYDSASDIDLLKLEKHITVLPTLGNDYYSAWYQGYLSSSGNYLLFIQSGDLLKPTMLENMFEQVIINHAEITQCGYILPTIPPTVHTDVADRSDELHSMALVKHPKQFLTLSPSSWRRLYQRDFLNKLDISHPLDLEDQIFSFLSFSYVQRLAVIPDCDYIKYISEESNIERDTLETYLVIFDHLYAKVRAAASMETMHALLSLELNVYRRLLQEETDNPRQHDLYNQVIERMNTHYDQYWQDTRWQDELSSYLN